MTACFFCVTFLFFLLVMDYPFLARLWNEAYQAEVIETHDVSLYRQEDAEKEAALRDARAYNKILTSGLSGDAKDVFQSGVAEPELSASYQSLLNSGRDGIMGTLEIPKIKVYLAIYHGAAEEILQKGAGHLEGSSLPVGGESTHALISAHRGLTQRKMFTDLDQVDKGDIFLLHILDDTLCYRVRDIRVIKPDEVDSLGIKVGEDLVTLITCTPYGLNTHRLLVEGERIPYTPEVEEEIDEEDKPFSFANWWWAVLSLVMFFIMVVLLVRYMRAGKKK